MSRNRTDRSASGRPTGFEVLGEHQPACTSGLILGNFQFSVNFRAFDSFDRIALAAVGAVVVVLAGFLAWRLTRRGEPVSKPAMTQAPAYRQCRWALAERRGIFS